jgi:hypothetical protein
MTITSITAEIPRDRYGRPLIVQPDGSKPQAYTRCTTLVGAYEDTFNLEQWKMRQAAIGLSMRPDLQTAVHAFKDDKKELNRICQDALDAAGSSSAATRGTAIHALTEQLDRGQLDTSVLPPETSLDLNAYYAATADLEPVHIEQMMVYDDWKVAGTPDRVVEYQGKRYIADLKTGSVDFGAGKIAAQLAVYAHSHIYNQTAERAPHGADLDKALVIHLPAGTGTCEVKWIDIRAGWEIAKTCLDVREKRKLSAAQLFTRFPTKTDVTLSQAIAGSRPDPVEVAIADATSRALVEAVWTANAATWTERHTELAKARIESLPTVA